MPTTARRGLKGNPFQPGETVRVKGEGVEAEVLGTMATDYGGHIRYYVKVGGLTKQCYAKELEAVAKKAASAHT